MVERPLHEVLQIAFRRALSAVRREHGAVTSGLASPAVYDSLKQRRNGIMTIHLPADLERSIEAAVQSGRFSSVDAAMAEAARLLLRRSKRTKPAKKLTEDEIEQQMLADGLLSQLPDTAKDVDDEDIEPVVIEGEPLSETIIRERR
jgi:Arc/MetJ-type ribon-helix-helix transcriptional regulator